MKKKKIKLAWIIIPIVIISAIAEFLFFFGDTLFKKPLPEGFIYSSGRMDSRVIDASSRVGGRILTILVNEGDIIKKGQLLATLSYDELAKQIQTAQSNIQIREIQKNRAKIDLQVTTDQVSSAIKQAEAKLNVAEANLARTRASHKQTNVDYERAESLFTTGAIPKRSYEGKRLAREISEKEVIVAEKMVEEAKVGLALAEDMNNTIKAQKTTIQGIQESIASGIADKEVLEIQQLELKILSPCDGIILDKVMDPGEILPPGVPVVTLIDPSQLFLKVYLKTEEMSKVKIGAEAKVTLDGIDKSFRATVIRVSEKAEFTPKNVETRDQRTNLVFEVRLGNFDDAEHILKSGMSANVVIRTDKSKNWDKSEK